MEGRCGDRGRDKENKHRVEDALKATRAALEEGIGPGGGVALLNASSAVTKILDKARGRGEKTGAPDHPPRVRGAYPPARVSTWASRAPSRRQVQERQEGEGLNVETGEDIEDLVKSGIIDPTMVTRAALQNAASIAKNILTTEAVSRRRRRSSRRCPRNARRRDGPLARGGPCCPPSRGQDGRAGIRRPFVVPGTSFSRRAAVGRPLTGKNWGGWVTRFSIPGASSHPSIGIRRSRSWARTRTAPP